MLAREASPDQARITSRSSALFAGVASNAAKLEPRLRRRRDPRLVRRRQRGTERERRQPSADARRAAERLEQPPARKSPHGARCRLAQSHESWFTSSRRACPTGPPRRRKPAAPATRERIVAAALDQLAEGGYASAGVQAIASRAGIATGTVYRHFPSKSELFAEVFRRASARELAVVAETAADDGRPARERLAAAAEAFARRALAEPTRAYALLAEPVDPAVEAERLTFRRGYRDVLARTIEQGIAAGELPAQDTQTVAAALVGALGEALVGPLSPGGHGGHEALVATLVQFCLDAVPARERELAI